MMQRKLQMSNHTDDKIRRPNAQQFGFGELKPFKNHFHNTTTTSTTTTTTNNNNINNINNIINNNKTYFIKRPF